jgi:hypothetical protein
MTKRDDGERFKQGDRDKIRLTDEQYQIVVENLRERYAFWEKALRYEDSKRKV